MAYKKETYSKWMESRCMITVKRQTKADLELMGTKSDSFDTIITALVTTANKHPKEYDEIIEMWREELRKEKLAEKEKRKRIRYP